MEKAKLREIYLNKRRRLTRRQIEGKSRKITQKVLGLVQAWAKSNISLYLPINNEAETGEIIKKLERLGATIYLPSLQKEKEAYCFVPFNGWSNLEEGPYSILQPKVADPIDPKLLDVVILPGLAFDKKGVRLGYGKGVFDKLLKASGALRVGLAYEFQIVDELPGEQHDLVMDLVVTEKNIYK